MIVLLHQLKFSVYVMRQKYLLTIFCSLLAVVANAYMTNWPIYGDVNVEDIGFAEDNSTIVTNIGDYYYDYQYCKALHLAVLRHVYPSNASGERDFVLVPTYIIVDGEAYRVVGVNSNLIGDEQQSIKNIYLHNELEFLGSRALSNAIAVESITIPASVKSISYDVFNGLVKGVALKSITFEDNEATLVIDGAGNAATPFANLPVTSLYIGRNFSLKTPFGTSSNATVRQTLLNLTMGGSGTMVTPEMFSNFKKLTSVTLNSGVVAIGDNAFSGDSVITELNLGAGVKYIGDYAFNGCKRVTSLTLPAGLDSLHVRAFVGMTGVQSLTIADTDSPLQLFGIPRGLYANESIFSHLTALESAYMGRNLLPTNLGSSLSAFYNAAMRRLTVGDHVTIINANEFRGCTRLEQLQLGSNITTIGDYAFYENRSLCGASIPDKVTRIGEYAFSGDSVMTTLSLGAGVKYIGDYAFNGCKRVTSLTLPAGLDSLHVRALVGMAGVQSLTIADTDSPLQLFGMPRGLNASESIFSHLTALESAYMGRNLMPTNLGNSLSAFNNAAMRRLTVGDHVTRINANEFRGCANLSLINSMSTTPPVCADASAFSGVDKATCALHVPIGCKDAYQTALVWKDFFSVTDDLPNDTQVSQGDVNGDTLVDVSDVVAIANYVMGDASGNFVVENADLNGNGEVDVADVVALANIVMGE